ncbi:FIST N-terminal domain-containing protein [Clostridium sp. LS]|uniref:FIST signal transduction protein n=1 Tax=unclassified Clostridium TaxID=2614128 RepID=UPI000298414C|nr:MAG: hypothetical protein A370_01430 [Clostridium sp. Maddingley MBC34-26]
MSGLKIEAKVGVIFLPGKIKEMINEIINERSKGNPAISEMTIAKLILKGINPNKFNNNSPDDIEIIEKLIKIAKQLNVKCFDNKGVNIKSSFSTKYIEEEVVIDIKNQLNIKDIRLIVFFASSNFNQQKLSKLMKEAFKECIVVGCSTAGELTNGHMLKNSVVAMAINSNIISDIKVEVIENIKEDLNLENTFTSFEDYFNESLYNMDTKKYIGMTLTDGLSMKEEKIMDLIGNRTNVLFVGGSAGDDNKFLRTFVSANGCAYTDAAVLILLKVNDNAEFGIIKTQSFEALDYTFIANKVNEEKREVIELNNRPAIVEYAKAVNASSIDDVSKYFMTNPLGLIAGENDIYVRGPQQVVGTSLSFYCNILEGMEVKLLKATNIIEDTKKVIEKKLNEFERLDGIINFQCTHRALELERKNLVKEYADIFKDIPTIGFSGYGEQFIGHMNHTSAMIVFKSKLII